VRKAERQDSEDENELMRKKFLNPAPRTPLVLIESHQVQWRAEEKKIKELENNNGKVQRQ